VAIPGLLLVGGVVLGYLAVVLPKAGRRRRGDPPDTPVEPRTALDDAPREHRDGRLPDLPSVELPDVDVSD
jgi:hypothetical protein